MYSEINKQLEELVNGIYREKKITTMITSLKKQLEQLEKDLYYLKKELDKEQVDVDQLGKTTVANIFYTIAGKKKERMEKEEQELVAAQLKYELCTTQIKEIKAQISQLSLERSDVSGSQSKYDELFKQKQEMIAQNKNDPERAEKINLLTQKISLYKNNIKEIEEAREVGNRVIRMIDSALESLQSAGNWGLWDTLGGGGLITTAIKHSHIDDAKDLAGSIQSQLRRFNTELADIKISTDISIDMDGFVKFADFFFDGLIADIFVQSKVGQSKESVVNVKNQVNRVLSKLSSMHSSDLSALNTSQSEFNALISSTN